MKGVVCRKLRLIIKKKETTEEKMGQIATQVRHYRAAFRIIESDKKTKKKKQKVQSEKKLEKNHCPW